MTAFESNIQLDPTVPLSTRDIVGLMTDYCNNKIHDELGRERSSILELIDNVCSFTQETFKVVIDGFNEGLRTIRENIQCYSNSQRERI